MEHPLVSVVTPSLNAGWRLVRCIESVARQTYGRVEHVVVDGGSTDGSQDLLERTRGIRWTSEPDEGQSDAIQKGIRMARGSLVAWLNADDAYEPDGVALLVGLLRGGGGWAVGAVRIIDGAATRIMRVPARLTLDDVLYDNPIPQPGVLVRRDAFEAAGGLDPEFHLAMDLDLWLRLFRTASAPVTTRRVVATFEVHAASKGGSRPFEDFLEEDAQAYLRNDLPAAAAAAFGRTVARRRMVRGLDPLSDLEGDVRLLAGGRGEVPFDVARRAAEVEVTLAAVRRRDPAALRSLLAPRLWTAPESRHLLLAALRSRISRMAGRR